MRRGTALAAVVLVLAVTACTGAPASTSPLATSLFGEPDPDRIVLTIRTCCGNTTDLLEMAVRPFPVLMADGSLIAVDRRSPDPLAVTRSHLDPWLLDVIAELVAAIGLPGLDRVEFDNPTGFADASTYEVVFSDRAGEHIAVAYDAASPAPDAPPEVHAMADLIALLERPPGRFEVEPYPVSEVQVYVARVSDVVGVSAAALRPEAWPLSLAVSEIPEISAVWRCTTLATQDAEGLPRNARKLSDGLDLVAYELDAVAYLPVIPGVVPCAPIEGTN